MKEQEWEEEMEEGEDDGGGVKGGKGEKEVEGGREMSRRFQGSSVGTMDEMGVEWEGKSV